MLHRPNPLSLHNVSRLILGRHFLSQQLRSKSSRRYNPRHHEDDDDDKIRKPKQPQEGGHIHLFKSRGQHILTNPRVLDSIVRKSDIKPTDTVFEIGPGTGNLTLKLLEAAEKVVAIEIDKRMVEILRNRTAEKGFEDRLTVISGDALKTEFPRFDLVVANIPYGISSPLVAKLVFKANQFRSATLLLQKEFARRLLAKPGDSDFNRLAVNVKLVADVEFIMDVSKREFVPIPKVDSSVVKIWPKAEIPNVDLHEWLAFTRMCFSKRNRTLGATFKQKYKVMKLHKLSALAATNEEHFVDCYSDDDGEEDEKGASDERDCLLSSCSGIEMNLFKEKVIGVLKSGGFEDKRPSKLCHEELLHLLSLFNHDGIYFHGHAKPRHAIQTEIAASNSP